VRRRTGGKNTGRVFADEAALEAVLKRGNAMTSEVVDLGSLTFEAQIAKMRGTSVLVGAHGAGLMHALFLADEAVLLEIHPSYRLDRHFRLAARMAGKVYMPLRSTRPVTCKGTSKGGEGTFLGGCRATLLPASRGRAQVGRHPRGRSGFRCRARRGAACRALL